MTFSIKELASRGVHPDAIEIRKWRKRYRLRVGELARMAGVDEAHLSQVELVRRALGPSVRARLQVVFERWKNVQAEP